MKVQKLVLEDRGSYLGMEKGCFVIIARYEKNAKRVREFQKKAKQGMFYQVSQ